MSDPLRILDDLIREFGRTEARLTAALTAIAENPQGREDHAIYVTLRARQKQVARAWEAFQEAGQ